MGQATFSQQGIEPLVFPVNPIYPGKTAIYSGSATGRTEGGDEYVYAKGQPYALLELKFEGMPASGFDGGFDYTANTQTAGTQSLVNWFLNVFGQSRAPFAYTDPFGKSHTVSVEGSRLDFSLTDYGLYNGAIVLKESIG